MQFKRLFFTIAFLLNFLLVSLAQEPTLLNHGGGVRTVEFSPVNASLVASAGESNIIKLWNLQNDTVQTLRGHTDIVNAIAFSPNGELLASVSNDKTLRLWNVQSQQNIATRNVTDRYQSIAFSPDGQRLATGGGRHVKLWNSRHQTEIATLQHNQDIRPVAFSDDGQLLAAGDGAGTVNVWDVQRRQIVTTLDGDPKNIKTVVFSPDDQYLASSGWDGQLKIWDVSTWDLLRTFPHTGYYDVAFSPDGKMLASTNNGWVNLWWIEDGARIARLPGPTDWIHPVDFSHNGTALAVGAEDGIVRIWRINTSLTDDGSDGVRILHVDTYLQQLPKANSTDGDNIPDPAPPPAVVRDFFELDPYYEQWINVGGLPVIASAQVNPYALKEAAWLILKMIGHRPEVLRAMVGNKTRFSIIAHTEIITEIPEYRNNAPPDFLIYRERGWGGSGIKQVTVSSSEEDILNYRGSLTRGRYSVLIHEVAHGIHKFGFNTVDPTFDGRLQDTYEAAMKTGLWNGTYASSDRKEYWAEGTQAWFHPNGGGSFDRFGDTRQALKMYDPGLARLLTEVYGDGQWRYTLPETRNHLQHLQGFNPREAPPFNGWPELETLYKELSNPNSTGGGKWVNLKPYAPNQLSRLRRSNVHGDRTTMIFVNSTDADVLIYGVSSNATGSFWTRIYPGRVRWTGSSVNKVWLVKDANGKNIAIFQTEDQTGRALIGASVNKANYAAQEDVNRNDSQPQVLIAASQHPPLYWIDTVAGTLHRLTDDKVETVLPSVQNATSLAVDVADEKLYWVERTSDRTGKIRRANLDGTNGQLVKDLTSVPHSIAIDAANDKLYLTNSWGKIQRINFDGSGFEPNLITGLDAPKHLTLDVAGGKFYWTERTNRIRHANLDGSNIQTLFTDLGTVGGIAIANGKLYWTEQTGESVGNVQSANLDGNPNVRTLASLRSVPLGITVDSMNRQLYWTTSQGAIQRVSLDRNPNFQILVVGLGTPAGIVVSTTRADVNAVSSDPVETIDVADINADGAVNKTDLLLLVAALGENPPTNSRTDVNGDGAVNVADLLLVIENLNDPVNAAAPSSKNTISSLDPTMLAEYLNTLHAENDGSYKYQQAIAFLQSFLAVTRPDKTQLLANYPNPFNPETWIPYQLSEPAEVTLTIYTVNGNLVRKLVLGHQPAGMYHSKSLAAYWDGRNEQGERVANGVYLYTLSAGDFTATRKMFIRK